MLTGKKTQTCSKNSSDWAVFKERSENEAACTLPGKAGVSSVNKFNAQTFKSQKPSRSAA